MCSRCIVDMLGLSVTTRGCRVRFPAVCLGFRKVLMKKTKTKEDTLYDALKMFQKALGMPSPDISINLRGGLHDDMAKPLLEQLRCLKEEYFKAFKVKPKIHVFFE